ncbi:uncharacterized protein BYT42DRAFT_66425 [Radiomyces spectabilis]|uniref:uncharacterized protein n=1 Tax=Radiomyces spectabilis TaxID=64574 RepID=UPI00221F64E2|nr:uncharacterized protein BYT42DRAFT_66425 [Radiomyces spectabilis]KAI8371391.1 hypothetical protein BYT42DRAFT_66425 [Radiomyces spectabilis]
MLKATSWLGMLLGRRSWFPLVTLTDNVDQDKVGRLPSQQVSSLVPGAHRKDWKGIIFQDDCAPVPYCQHRAQISIQSSIFGLILRIIFVANVANWQMWPNSKRLSTKPGWRSPLFFWKNLVSSRPETTRVSAPVSPSS